jgi:hypothetical protein
MLFILNSRSGIHHIILLNKYNNFLIRTGRTVVLAAHTHKLENKATFKTIIRLKKGTFMYSLIWSGFRKVIINTIYMGLFFLFPFNAHSLDISVVNTQANPNSCQSYAFAIMLALKDGRYGDSLKALHQTELSIRKEIRKVASGNDVTHEHWKVAISNYTGGSYSLKIEGFDNIVDWNNAVVSETKRNSYTGLTGKLVEVVATSFHEIDGSAYGSGHVALLVSAVENQSEVSYLNGGVKLDAAEGYELVCTPADVGRLGSGKYLASFSTTSNYELKTFGGKYKIYKIE